MKRINLYYNDVKINNRPLTISEVNEIFKNEYIYKRNIYTDNLIKIPTSKIIKINTITKAISPKSANPPTPVDS